MDKQVLEMLKSDDSDSARLLLLELASMLRTGKGGLLNNKELRLLLADRLDNALLAKADEVSDALCITDGSSASKYGNAAHDFMLWYFGFMDQGKKPTGVQIDQWCNSHPNEKVANVSKSMVDKWVAAAKNAYEPALKGAATISSLRC